MTDNDAMKAMGNIPPDVVAAIAAFEANGRSVNPDPTIYRHWPAIRCYLQKRSRKGEAIDLRSVIARCVEKATADAMIDREAR